MRPEITPGFEPPDNIYLDKKPAVVPTLLAWPPPGAVGAMSTVASRNAGKRGWSTAVQTGSAPLDWAAMAAAASRSLINIKRDFDWAIRTSITKHFRDFGSPPLAAPPPPPRPENSKEEWQAAMVRRERRTEAILQGYGSEGERPRHFETGAGFALAGSSSRAVTLGRFAMAASEHHSAWWRIERSETSPASFWDGIQLAAPAPMLIELANGNWIGAAALPGYIATLTVQGGGAASLIYRPVGRPEVGYDTEVAVAQLRSGVLSAEAGTDLAATVREGKEEDPVRGVLAAYLYDAQGDTESIRRTAYFLALAGIPLPYDVAMLAQVPVSQREPGMLVAEIPATAGRPPRSLVEEARDWTFRGTPAISARVAGIFPWLRQGWALLEEDDPSPLFPKGLATLRDDLLAHPFTTLNARGGQRLGDLIRRM